MPITHRSLIQSAFAGVAVALSLSAIAAPGALPTPVGPLKLTKTFIDAGTMGGASLPAGFYTLVGTPVEVTCAVTDGCTVSASLEAQVAQVGANTVALCFYLDGVQVSCPTNDRLSATTGFKVMSHQSSTRISPIIKHKLEMRAYSEQPNQLYRYQAEYRVFNK